MPVTVNVPMVLVRAMLPLVLLLALKLVTVLLLANDVPVAELVVSNAPFRMPAPASLTAPAVPVRLMLPLVLMLPAFRITLRPALAVMAPEVLPTLALIRMSFAAPVVVNATVPVPFAVTALLNVMGAPDAVRLMLPLLVVLILPVVVRAPVVLMTISLLLVVVPRARAPVCAI